MVHGGGYSGGGSSGGYGGSSGELTPLEKKVCVPFFMIMITVAIFIKIPLTIFTLCYVSGAILAALCLLHVAGPRVGCFTSRTRHHWLRRSVSGTMRILQPDGTPVGRLLVILCVVSTFAMLGYAVSCAERVEVLAGQTKLVTRVHAYFLGQVDIQRTDASAELEAYYFSGDPPPLTGPMHCGGFNSTLTNLCPKCYEYDSVELNAGGKGVAKLWIDDAECSTRQPDEECKLELRLYKSTEPKTDDGSLVTPDDLAKAKMSSSTRRAATLSFTAKYSNQPYAVTYFDKTYHVSNPESGVGARATITYCEPTFDLRARGNWRDVCVGSPCTLFIGSGAESSWADAFKVAFAGTASLVLVAPGATTPVKVAIAWRPRWYLMLGIACLPLLMSACVDVGDKLIQMRRERAPRARAPQPRADNENVEVAVEWRRPPGDAAERDPLVTSRVDPRAPATTSSLNSGAVPNYAEVEPQC